MLLCFYCLNECEQLTAEFTFEMNRVSVYLTYKCTILSCNCNIFVYLQSLPWCSRSSSSGFLFHWKYKDTASTKGQHQHLY